MIKNSVKKYCQFLLLSSCYSLSSLAAAEVSSHWLAPNTVVCDNKKCLNILTISDSAASNQWLAAHQAIAGFNYQPGYFYHVQLSHFTSATGPKLVQVLERTAQHFLPATKLLANRHWQLTFLHTLPQNLLATLKKKPYISLSNHGINGFSGCNKIFGKQEYIFEADDYQQSMIKFGPMAMTRMACREQNTNQVEHHVSLLLTQVNKFSVDWPVLNFYNNDKLLAQFTSK